MANVLSRCAISVVLEFLGATDIASDTIDVLDMTIFKGPRWRRTGLLDARPFSKPSHRGSILTSSSSHHPAQHKSWPLGRFIAFDALSSESFYARQSKKTFLQKLVFQDPAHPAVPILQSSLVHGNHSTRSKRENCSWLVLPYHPALRSLTALVRNIADKWRLIATLGDRPSMECIAPRISWAHGSRYLMQILEPRKGG